VLDKPEQPKDAVAGLDRVFGGARFVEIVVATDESEFVGGGVDVEFGVVEIEIGGGAVAGEKKSVGEKSG